MDVSTREKLASAGLVAVTIVIALGLSWIATPYLVSIFKPLYQHPILWWTLITPITGIVALGSAILAFVVFESAARNLRDISRERIWRIAPRIALKVLLSGALGALVFLAFMLLPNI